MNIQQPINSLVCSWSRNSRTVCSWAPCRPDIANSMKLVANVNADQQAVLDHLRELLNGEAEEDGLLMYNFSQSLRLEYAEVLSEDPLNNPLLSSFVTLLYRVVTTRDSSDEYEEPLVYILGKMPFENVLKIFPPEAIVETLETADLRVASIITNVLLKHMKSGDDDGPVFDFIAENDVDVLLTKRYFEKIPDTFMRFKLLSLASLLTLWFGSDHFFLENDKWSFLADYSVEYLLLEQNYIVSYLTFVSRMDEAEREDDTLIRRLLDIDLSPVVELHDELLELGIVEGLALWVLGYPFDWVERPVAFILERRYQLSTDEDGEAYQIGQFYDFFNSIAELEDPRTREYLENFVEMHPDILAFNLDEQVSRRFFFRLPFWLIKNKQQFFEEHFANFQIAEAGSELLICYSLLFEDPEFFKLIVDSNQLTAERLKLLPLDLLFGVLRQMVNFPHSTEYLLHNLDSIVLAYLIKPDRSLVNSEVWEEKQDTIYTLLQKDETVLGFWKQPLADCYDEMVNGRRFRDAVPIVKTLGM